MEALISIVAGVIFIFLWKLWEDRKKPPGPWGLPIIGYIPFLSRQPYLDLQKLGKKYGNVFSISLGSRYVVVLNDFQSTKDAFAQDVFIGRPPEFAFEVNKETIESEAMTGLPWKELRRFSVHMLKDLGLGKSKMEEHIQEEIFDLLKYLEEYADKPFLIGDVLTSSMSNNITALVCGKRLKYDDPDRKMITKALNESSQAAGQTAWTLFFPWLKNILKILGVGDLDAISRRFAEVKAYVWKQIEKHEKTLNPNNIRDYIDGYLLEMEKRENDPVFHKRVLQDMALGFFGAGSETVRLSVEWLVLITAIHQDAQRRIQTEIDDAIGHNRLPTWPDQKNMTYTEAFIAEVMRWKTIIPLNLLRYTLADAQLNGFVIPKHTYVLNNLWAIHHDPEFWGKDADEFRPERFLTEDGKFVKKRDQYIPFSIGKRACLGEQLGKVEVFLYFASILQKFNVRLPDGKVADLEGKLGIGLVPKPHELIFTKRN